MKITIDTDLKMNLVEQVVLSIVFSILGEPLSVEFLDDEEYEPFSFELLAGIDEPVKLRYPEGWLLYVPGNLKDCVADYHMSLNEALEPMHEAVDDLYI